MRWSMVWNHGGKRKIMWSIWNCGMARNRSREPFESWRAQWMKRSRFINWPGRSMHMWPSQAPQNQSKRQEDAYVYQYMLRSRQTHAMHRKTFSNGSNRGQSEDHLLPHAFHVNSNNIIMHQEHFYQKSKLNISSCRSFNLGYKSMHG